MPPREHHRPDQDRSKVLLIDDDPVLLLLMVSAFNAAGYSTLVADNGRKGVAMLEAYRPDLVVTDIVMPEMEGIGVILEIKRRASPPKIIAISGGATSHARNYLNWAQQLGADAVLPKPFRMAALTALAARTLEIEPDLKIKVGG